MTKESASEPKELSDSEFLCRLVQLNCTTADGKCTSVGARLLRIAVVLATFETSTVLWPKLRELILGSYP